MAICKLCNKLMRGPVAKTPCGHLFHNDCIREYFRHSPNCPVCKKQCKEANLLTTVLGFHAVDDEIDPNFLDDGRIYDEIYDDINNAVLNHPSNSYEKPFDSYEVPREHIYDMPPTLPVTPIPKKKPNPSKNKPPINRAYSIPEEIPMPTKKRIKREKSLLIRIWEFIREKKWFFIGGLIAFIVLLAIIVVVVVILVTRKHNPKTTITTRVYTFRTVPVTGTTHHVSLSNRTSVSTSLFTNPIINSTTTNSTIPSPTTNDYYCDDDSWALIRGAYDGVQCFKAFNNTYRRFDDAESYCETLNSDLASIFDIIENYNVTDWIAKHVISHPNFILPYNFWIGLKWQLNCCTETLCNFACNPFYYEWGCASWTDGRNVTFFPIDNINQCLRSDRSICCIPFGQQCTVLTFQFEDNANLHYNSTWNLFDCNLTNNFVCKKNAYY